jgi:hypothetical protein
MRRALVVISLVTTTMLSSGVANGGPPGAMTIDPTSGPSATVITVTSVTPCPPGSDGVNVGLLDPSNVLDSTTATPDAGGNWTAQLTVPAGTPPQTLQVDATCVQGTDPTLAYQVEDFVVTEAPAPPAPVTAAPTTTG